LFGYPIIWTGTIKLLEQADSPFGGVVGLAAETYHRRHSKLHRRRGAAQLGEKGVAEFVMLSKDAVAVVNLY
jgi:hypothetical protein